MWDPAHFSTRHRVTQADNGQGGPRNSNPTQQPFGFGATGRQAEHQESNQLSWSMLPPKQQDSAFSSAAVLAEPFHLKAPHQSSFAYPAPAQSQQQTFSDYGPKPAMFGSCSTPPHLSTNTNTRANRMTTSPFSIDQHRNVFGLSFRTPFDGTSTTASLSSSSSSNPFPSNTRTGSTLPFVFGLPEHAKPTTDVTASSSSGHKYVVDTNQPHNNTAPVFSSNNINSTDTTRMAETFGPWGVHGLVSKNNTATKTFSPMNSGYFHDGNQPTSITTNTTTTGMFPQTGCPDETNGGFPASTSSSLSVSHRRPEQAQQQSTAWSGVDGLRTNPDHLSRSGFCGNQTTNNSCPTGECTPSFQYSSGRLGGCWEPLPSTFVGTTTAFAEADTIVSSSSTTTSSLFPTTTTMLGNNNDTNNKAVDDSTKPVWTSWGGSHTRTVPHPTTTNNTHEFGTTTTADSKTTKTSGQWDWSTTAPPSSFAITTTSSASPSSSWSQDPGVVVDTTTMTTATTPRPVTPVVASSVLATPELPQRVNDRGIRALLQCKQEMEASPIGQSIHNKQGVTANRSCGLESASSLVGTTRRIRPRGFS